MAQPKRLRFAEEFALDCNATQAAIRAGYSPRTAKQQGCRLLADPAVQGEIARLRAQHAEELGLTVEQVVRALVQIAEDPTTRACDRIAAYDKLMKHLGGYAPVKLAQTNSQGCDLPAQARDWEAELAARLTMIAGRIAEREAASERSHAAGA